MPEEAPGLLLTPDEPEAARNDREPGDCEPGHLELGCLEPAQRCTREIHWRRTGGGPLRVLALRTGCGCAALRGLPEALPEGAWGTAQVLLDAPVDAGPVDVPVRVVTDAAPPGDVVTLRVRAFVGRRLVVRPAALDLGRRSPGARVSARLSVHLPPGEEGPVSVAVEGWPGSARLVRAALQAQRGPDVLLESGFGPVAGTCVGLLRVEAPRAGATAVPLHARVVEAAAR